MATARSLSVSLKAKTGAFDAAMKKSAKHIKRLRKTFGGLAKAAFSLKGAIIAVGSALAIMKVTGAIKRFALATIKAASDAEEVASKFAAVFKEQAGAADAFVNRLSRGLGRSTTELRSFMATMQDTFVPLGFAREEGRKMSQTITQLAIDLASFNNTAESSAIRDLQSAIVGNHETMRKYGVIITQRTLDQELLSKGFNKVAKGATNQQKALARLAIILRSTTDAQGDAARTAGSYANMVRRLTSEWTAVKEEIGQELMPVAKAFIEGLMESLPQVREEVIRVAKDFAAWFEERGGAQQLVKDLEDIVSALAAVGRAIQWVFDSGKGLSDEIKKSNAEAKKRFEAFKKQRAARGRTFGAELVPTPPPKPTFEKLHVQLAASRQTTGPVKEFGTFAQQAERHVKKLNESLKEAAAIRKAMETPAEAFKRERDKLEALRSLGVLSEDDFRRALDKSFEAARTKAQAAQPRQMEFAVVRTVQEAMALAGRPDPIQNKQLTALDRIVENTEPRNQPGGIE